MKKVILCNNTRTTMAEQAFFKFKSLRSSSIKSNASGKLGRGSGSSAELGGAKNDNSGRGSSARESGSGAGLCGGASGSAVCCYTISLFSSVVVP